MSCLIEALLICLLVLGCVLTVSFAVSRFAGLLESDKASLPRRRRLRRRFVFVAVFILSVAIVGVLFNEVTDVERTYKRGGPWGKVAIAVAGFIIIPGLLASGARALFDHALVSRYRFTVPPKTLLVDPDKRRVFQAGTYWAAVTNAKTVDLGEATEPVASETAGIGIVRWVPDPENIFPFVALGNDGVRKKVQAIFRAEVYPDLSEYQPSLGVIFTKNSVQRPTSGVDIASGLLDIQGKVEFMKEVEAFRASMTELLDGSPPQVLRRMNQLLDDLNASIVGVR
jgi:hypothetical protein